MTNTSHIKKKKLEDSFILLTLRGSFSDAIHS